MLYGRLADQSSDEDVPGDPERLPIYFEANPNMQGFIWATLTRISDLLADTVELESRYGIKMPFKAGGLTTFQTNDLLSGKEPKAPKKLLAPRRRHMNLLKCSYKNARFNFRDEKKFDALIQTLDSCTSKLERMCGELESQQIQRYLLSIATVPHDAQSRTLATAVNSRAKLLREKDRSTGGYDWLSEVLRFKADLNEGPDRSRYLDINKYYLLPSRWIFGDAKQYTLAHHGDSRAMYYVVGYVHHTSNLS